MNLVTSLSSAMFDKILEWCFIPIFLSSSVLQRFQSAFLSNHVIGPGSGSEVVGQLSNTGLWSEDSSLIAIGSCKSSMFLFRNRSRYVGVL